MARITGERAWKIIVEKVNRIMKKPVPMRRRRNYDRPKWMSTGILFIL